MATFPGYVGVQSLTDGGQSALFRQGKTGEMIVRDRHVDQATRGLVFAACIPPGTGQAPGTAIGTTACFTLANPSGSGKNLVLWSIDVGYISGTLGAGVLALLAHFSASGAITAPSGGTAITPTGMRLGSNDVSIANCRFNNTVPATGLMIRSLANLGAGLASTAAFPSMVRYPLNGEVVVGPGSAVSAQAIAAGGTSPLIVVSALWAEENT